jgi:hypothetical protein
MATAATTAARPSNTLDTTATLFFMDYRPFDLCAVRGSDEFSQTLFAVPA